MAWGLVFAIPQLLTELKPFEVAISRYFFFGLASAVTLIFRKKHLFKNFSLYLWAQAFLLAFVSNIVHYTALVYGLRETSPAFTTLILSLNPIFITLYGGWLGERQKYKIQKMPLAAIAAGLLLVSLPLMELEFSTKYITMSYLFGLIYALVALGTWTWYIVSNSRILTKNCQIESSDWVTAIGVSTLLLVLVLGTLYIYNSAVVIRTDELSTAFYQVLFGGLVLGLISSWIATYLWNHAVKRLPITFAGQLTLFETVFALIYVFIINQRLPEFSEIFGILLMLGGVFFSYRAIRDLSFVST